MTVIQGIHTGQSTNIGATADGELNVRAIVEEEIEHASGKGDAYVWTSANTDIDAGDTRLIIRNTSNKLLILDRLFAHPANVVCQYHLGLGTGTTALAGGTIITAVNMNEDFSTRTEDYDAMDDDTAIADATLMFPFWVSTTQSIEIPLHGIVLGKNGFIQINQETESTSGQISILGHFDVEVG